MSLCWLTMFYKVSMGIHQETLEYFMLPSADSFYGNADFIFQQD